MYGLDEQNCSQWVCDFEMYQCRGTGQCISRSHLCDGEFDCNNGEDELNCPNRTLHWSIEDRCNKSVEHFCITSEFLSNQTLHRPCIEYTKAGDGKIDCIGGRDERNVFSCPDHQMLGDRFICDNETKCVIHTSICDGIDDCVDRTDELICFWNRHECRRGKFACLKNGICIDHRCDPEKICPNNEHLFWCTNSKESVNVYRSSKIRRPSNYISFCNNYRYSNLVSSSVILSPATTRAKYDHRIHGFCNRGVYLMTKNGKSPLCFLST